MGRRKSHGQFLSRNGKYSDDVMSPFARTIPFKKIVPQLRNANWVIVSTVVIGLNC